MFYIWEICNCRVGYLLADVYRSYNQQQYATDDKCGTRNMPQQTTKNKEERNGIVFSYIIPLNQWEDVQL